MGSGNSAVVPSRAADSMPTSQHARDTSPMPSKITYWLWHGQQIVSTVRLPLGVNDDHVRSVALDWHNRVPLCWPDAPFERAIKILSARVVTYPGGN